MKCYLWAQPVIQRKLFFQFTVGKCLILININQNLYNNFLLILKFTLSFRFSELFSFAFTDMWKFGARKWYNCVVLTSICLLNYYQCGFVGKKTVSLQHLMLRRDLNMNLKKWRAAFLFLCSIFV